MQLVMNEVTVKLSLEERDHIIDVLQNAHQQMLHELHHADTRAFEETLRQRVELNEQLLKKLQA